MLGAWVIGRGIGAVAQRTIEEHLDEYRQQNPVASADADADGERDVGSQSAEVGEPPVQTEPVSAAEAA
jgi:hypothetical protein